MGTQETFLTVSDGDADRVRCEDRTHPRGSRVQRGIAALDGT